MFSQIWPIVDRSTRGLLADTIENVSVYFQFTTDYLSVKAGCLIKTVNSRNELAPCRYMAKHKSRLINAASVK